MRSGRKPSFLSVLRGCVGGWYGLLLAAVLLRGLTPAGYMPAAGQPFGFEICRAGWLAGAVGEPDGGTLMPGDRGVDCVFGAAPGVAPVAHVASFVMAPAAVSWPPDAGVLSFVPVRGYRLSQPRAPPSFS